MTLGLPYGPEPRDVGQHTARDPTSPQPEKRPALAELSVTASTVMVVAAARPVRVIADADIVPEPQLRTWPAVSTTPTSVLVPANRTGTPCRRLPCESRTAAVSWMESPRASAAGGAQVTADGRRAPSTVAAVTWPS